MSKAKRISIDDDADDNDVVDLKSQRRPLHKGETVPHIPTMFEQMDSAWAAANQARSKSR